MTETRAVPSLFIVPCPNCGKDLEAHSAEWCRCVGKEVSPSCPQCGVCLCKAPEATRRAFWRKAPAWLQESRTAEIRRRGGEASSAPAEVVDVLIVDDDEEIRLIAAYSVQQMGYRVAMASTGQEALAAIEQNPPRVMITDALMPRMDGRDLCQAVKTAHPEIKVVIMTSLYTAPRYKYEAYKTFHADEYLAKPIDFSQLRDVLQRLMSEVAS